MASADLLRREEEFYSSLFDSAKGNANALPAAPADGDAGFAPPWPLLKLWPVEAGDGARSRSQLIETKIEALEDMATRVRMLVFAFCTSCHTFSFFFSSLVHGPVKNFRASPLMTNENKN